MMMMDVLFLCCLFVIFDHQVVACPEACNCRRGYVLCNDKQLSIFPHLQTIPAKAEHLWIEKNRITDIRLTGDGANRTRIRWLDLTSNLLTTIPSYKDSILSGFSGLTKLDLHQNQIHHIADDAFLGLPNLRLLYLSRNRLKKVAASWFVKLFSLTELYLNNNFIFSFEPENFSWPDSLTTLMLAKNRITTIPPLPIKDCTKKLKDQCARAYSDLQDNDIYCGCRRPEHNKQILKLTLPITHLCCVDNGLCFHQPFEIFLKSYVERSVCGKPVIRINPNRKGPDVCLVKGEPKSKVKVNIDCLTEYQMQDNQSKVTYRKMIKCEAENKFGKTRQNYKFDGEACQCQYSNEYNISINDYCANPVEKQDVNVQHNIQLLPLWSEVIFCLLSFVPAFVILTFVMEICMRKELIQHGDDDKSDTSD